MKKTISTFLILLTLSLCGCKNISQNPQIVATTMPLFTFATAICDGTELSVGQLIHDDVSCLHDYTLQINQMRMLEGADIVIVNGAGLEDFLDDALNSAKMVIDSSAGIDTHCTGHDHAEHHGHDHNQDAHIWLSPTNAITMAQNICKELCAQYPQHKTLFRSNLAILIEQLEQLQAYGEESLSSLGTRELITFHDGFSYFADSFDMHILYAIEEEAGSETSAAQLIELIKLVSEHKLSAIFTEKNGSAASANIVAAETDVAIFSLDMGISNGDYFEVMYHNIDTVKEALG